MDTIKGYKEKITKNKSSNHILLLTAGLIILAVLVLSGCSSAGSQETAETIQKIIWQWESVTDQSTGAITTVPNPANYTITFYPDNQLSGQADCNAFSGTYSQENGFSIKLGASTMAYCGDASLDQKYLNLLSNVAAGGPDTAGGFALEFAGGAQRMLFKNAGAAPSP